MYSYLTSPGQQDWQVPGPSGDLLDSDGPERWTGQGLGERDGEGGREGKALRVRSGLLFSSRQSHSHE